jgi:hypothetical protein
MALAGQAIFGGLRFAELISDDLEHVALCQAHNVALEREFVGLRGAERLRVEIASLSPALEYEAGAERPKNPVSGRRQPPASPDALCRAAKQLGLQPAHGHKWPVGGAGESAEAVFETPPAAETRRRCPST